MSLLLQVLGAASITTGCALVAPALALIVAGCLLVVFGLAAERQ